ncbi:MAG TPA: hypothetical protein VGK41_05455 [Solirubrobacterales bacterium]
MAERSGVHLTGADSGWPVGSAAEPGPRKDGTGADPHSRADSVAGNTFEVNERQRIVVDATGGTWKPKFGGKTAAAGVSATATAKVLREALEALESIGAGNVDVTGGPGNAGGTLPYYVTFKGALKGQNVALIEVVEEVTTGGAGTVTVTTTTEGS